MSVTRRRAVLTCLLLVAAALVAAVAAQPVQDPGNGTADERADALLTAYMRKLGIPGLQVAVVKDGRLIAARQHGRASLELDVPVSDETVFAINSVTKAFTGVAVMQLVERGRVDLGAPIGRYLTDLPSSWRHVTIRQLLTHMSGLPDVVRAPMAEANAAAAWEWVVQQPVAFAPGDRFSYNQTNYALLQHLVNMLGGRPADEGPAVEQAARLGLTHTRYGDTTDVVPGKAPTYRFVGNGPARRLTVVHERFVPARYGASGLNSTAKDLAAWLVALESGALLSPSGLDPLWTPARFNDGTVGQWALGWQVVMRAGTRAAGMTGGGRAALAYYPEHHLGVVILTNLSGAFPEDIIDAVANAYVPALRLTGVPALRHALESGGYANVDAAAQAIEAASPGFAWPEAELNDWGYRLLATGRTSESVAVFAFIAARFPVSGNAFDSLGEALAATGDVAGAVRAYRRSLELDPANTNATRQIERLQARP